MSLTVIKPLSAYCSSTTSSFSTRCRCRIFSASSSVVPTGTVIRFSLVITCEIGRSKRVSKRRSRLVRMPHQLAVLGDRNAGNAVALHHFQRVGDLRFGLDRDRDRRSCRFHCASRGPLLRLAARGVMLRWMIPMPPCCASAIARCDSVTVSMAELTIGNVHRDVAG